MCFFLRLTRFENCLNFQNARAIIFTGHCVKMYAFWVASKNKILLIKKARSQADMMNLRASAKPFKIREVLAQKTLHELEMYKTIPYTYIIFANSVTCTLQVLWAPVHGRVCMLHRCVFTPKYTSATLSLQVVHICVYVYKCVYACICIWMRMCVYMILLDTLRRCY